MNIIFTYWISARQYFFKLFITILPLTDSLPKWLQSLRLGEAEAKSWEPGSPHRCQEPNTWAGFDSLPGAFTENGLEVQQPDCDSCKTLALRRQLNMLKGNILCSFTETELKQVPASLPEDRMLSLSKVECYSDLKQTPRESETVHSWSGYKQKSG